MFSQQPDSSWKKLERGQALVEYWPTIPIAIAVMIAASAVVSFVGSAFLRTANGLESYCPTSEEDAAPTIAEIHNHKIEPSGVVYDPETNRTTVAFTVTSGPQPSISHWVLGIPKSVADRILSTSEAASWTDNDPTTGVAGLKFDIGYEASGGNNGGGNNGGGNNGGGNNGGGNNDQTDPSKGKGNGKGVGFSRFGARMTALTAEGTDTRVIVITLDGNFLFDSIPVTTKAGSDQVGTAMISGPVALADEDGSESNAPQGGSGGVDRLEGC